MPALEKVQVISALQSKGFREEPGARNHRYFVYYDGDRKTRIKTKTSHSPKVRTLDNSLVKKMADQCHVTKEEFVQLVRCPLTAEKYRLVLLTKKLLQ